MFMAETTPVDCHFFEIEKTRLWYNFQATFSLPPLCIDYFFNGLTCWAIFFERVTREGFHQAEVFKKQKIAEVSRLCVDS